jgi:hypothetical protein
MLCMGLQCAALRMKLSVVILSGAKDLLEPPYGNYNVLQAALLRFLQAEQHRGCSLQFVLAVSCTYQKRNANCYGDGLSQDFRT